jgi:hypothetical protein
VDVPNTALSKRDLRASAGKEKRAFVAMGGRLKGGDRNRVSNGSTMKRNA